MTDTSTIQDVILESMGADMCKCGATECRITFTDGYEKPQKSGWTDVLLIRNHGERGYCPVCGRRYKDVSD